MSREVVIGGEAPAPVEATELYEHMVITFPLHLGLGQLCATLDQARNRDGYDLVGTAAGTATISPIAGARQAPALMLILRRPKRGEPAPIETVERPVEGDVLPISPQPMQGARPRVIQ